MTAARADGAQSGTDETADEPDWTDASVLETVDQASLPGWRMLQSVCLALALLWAGTAWWMGQQWAAREAQTAEQSLFERAQAQADHTAELLAQRLELARQLATALALVDVIGQGLTELRPLMPAIAKLPVEERHARLIAAPAGMAINQMLERIDPALGLSQIYVLDAEGWCVGSSRWRDPNVCIGANYKSRDYFRKAVNSQQSFQFAVGRQVRVPSLFFGGRIGGAAHPSGVVVVRETPEGMAKVLPATSTLGLVVDQRGIVLAGTRSGVLLRHVPGYPAPDAATLADTYGGMPLLSLAVQPT